MGRQCFPTCVIMAATIISRSFRCLRDAERFACKDMADASISLTPFVPTALVDAHWLGYPAAARPHYIAAWRGNFQVASGTVTIMGVETGVYFANRLWMQQLEAKFLNGCLSTADPLCQQLTFPAPTEPDCIYS